MTGLLRAEVKRLTSRRLTRVLALVFLGILLLSHLVAAARSREASAMERAQNEQSLRVCEQARASGDLPDDITCESFGVYDPRFSAEDALPDTAGSVAVGAALMAFVLGASFVGAEWAAGTMQALLFWEPRRERVLLGKGLALVAVMAAFVVAMQVVGSALTLLVAATRGTTEGLDASVFGDAVATAGRGLIVVTFTGLLGFAVAGLARVTGAALGAAFVYFAILEQVVANLRPGWFRYLIGPNTAAVLTGGIGEHEGAELVLSAGRGTLTLAVYLVLVLGAFYAVFSRRDVT